MRSTVVYVALTALVPASLLLASAGAHAQSAQGVPSIATGARVRITAPNELTPARQAGRLVSLQRDTLVLQPDGSGASLALPLAGVSGIEVSTGSHRSTGTGVIVGVLAGVVTGGVVGAATYRDSKPSQLIDPVARSASAFAGGLVGAVAGGVIGGLVGHAHQSDEWERVPFAQRAALFLLSPDHLRVTPASRRVALSLRLQFGGA